MGVTTGPRRLLAALALVASATSSAPPPPPPPTALLDDGDVAHNAPEAWARAFAGGIAPPQLDNAGGGGGNGPRALQSASTVAFSVATIASGGSVNVSLQLDTSLVPLTDVNALSFYVAVYAARQPGAAIDLNGSTPVRYQACAAASPAGSFAATGAATFRFALNNLHSGGYVAYLIRGGLAGPVGAPASAPVVQKTWVAGGSKPWVSLTGANGTRAGNFAGAVVAVSSPLAFSAPNEPTMVRVTPGSFAGELRVTWAHAVGTTGGSVSFSPRADMSGEAKVGAVPPTTLTTDDVCALGPAATTGFRDFGAQFTAALDLRAFAGSIVFYTVGAADNAATTSAVMSLRVPELPGSFSGRPQLWLSWADQGVGYHDDSAPGRNYNNGVVALATSDAVAADVEGIDGGGGGGGATAGMALQGVTVAGDATYADGYESVWEDYFSMMRGVMPSTPYLLSGGNHELDWAAGAQYNSPSGRTLSPSFWSTGAGVPADNSISSGGECGLAYKILPSGSATPAAPYFVYAAGLMTVLSVSSELDMSPGSPQGVWLRAALAAIDRSVTPFVMLFMHRSPYVKPTSKAGAWPSYDPRYAGDYSAMLYFQAVLEPLLLQYQVDIFYTGHTHVTQRACATINFTCAMRPTLNRDDGFFVYAQPPAPVYFVVGNLGANTDGTNGNPSPPWLDFESAAFAYARIVIRSATVLEVTLVDTLSGSVIDRSRIVKAPQPAPIAPSSAPKGNGAAIGGGVAGVLAVVAIGVWAAGNARVRGLISLSSQRYVPFSGRDGAVAAANPGGGAAALDGVVVVPSGEARRARVEAATRSGGA